MSGFFWVVQTSAISKAPASLSIFPSNTGQLQTHQAWSNALSRSSKFWTKSTQVDQKLNLINNSSFSQNQTMRFVQNDVDFSSPNGPNKIASCTSPPSFRHFRKELLGFSNWAAVKNRYQVTPWKIPWKSHDLPLKFIQKKNCERCSVNETADFNFLGVSNLGWSWVPSTWIETEAMMVLPGIWWVIFFCCRFNATKFQDSQETFFKVCMNFLFPSFSTLGGAPQIISWFTTPLTSTTMSHISHIQHGPNRYWSYKPT